MNIEITANDVRRLRDSGPGWALVWDGTAVRIARSETGDDGSVMRIGDYHALDDLTGYRIEQGATMVTADDLAYDLTDIANDYADTWGDIRAIAPRLLPLTRALRAHGITPNGPGIVTVNEHGTRRLIQHYRTPAPGGYAELTTTERPGDPIRLAVRSRRGIVIAALHGGVPAHAVAARVATVAR